MRYQGHLARWKDDKGFGFIAPDGGGEQVFVHVSAFTNRRRRPEGNERVSFELKVDGKGRAQAHAVSFAGERSLAFAARGRSLFPPLFAIGFLAALGTAVLAGHLPILVPGFYLVASVVAFIAYALDKSAAERGGWRTQEGTLHLLALIGGWPGALAAQRLLRHKSAKPSFQAGFWFTVVANCAALGWLASPSGAAVLRSAMRAL